MNARVLPVCGIVAILAGLVILRINPPLPQAFGGSFHGNIKELSSLADAAAWVAIAAGFALLGLAALGSALRRPLGEGSGPTAEPTSRAPSRRPPPSG